MIFSSHRLAAIAHHAAFEVAVRILRPGKRVAVALNTPSAKNAPAESVPPLMTRLEQHRMALRWTRHIERASHRKVPPLVVHARGFCSGRNSAVARIVINAIIVPAVPQAFDDLDELVGAS